MAQAAKGRDALDEFDRAEILRQAQEEEDEQTWLSDLAKDEETRPKTRPQSVVDDYEEVAEEEFKAPVHYKKKQQKNFLYEVSRTRLVVTWTRTRSGFSECVYAWSGANRASVTC